MTVAAPLPPQPIPKMRPVRVELPGSLCLLAKAPRELTLSVAAPVTQRSVLDALEAAWPALSGTLRDHATGLRRPYIRFYASMLDYSHAAPDDLLPAEVAEGREPLLIIGAISGG